MTDINVTIGTNDINIELGIDDINVTVDSGVSNNYIAEDTPFYFNGFEGNTYLKYNLVSSRLELWVNGSKKAEWS